MNQYPKAFLLGMCLWMGAMLECLARELEISGKFWTAGLFTLLSIYFFCLSAWGFDALRVPAVRASEETKGGERS